MPASHCVGVGTTSALPKGTGPTGLALAVLCACLLFGGFAQLVSKSSCSKLGVHTRRDLMAIARKWPNSLEVVQGCFRGLSWDQSTGPPSMWLA